MKLIDTSKPDKNSGTRLSETDTFNFRCHPDLACFNQCCRNLNLFLYPYDVIRLRHHLQISSDQFLERFVDVVMRPGNHFPSVLLKMTENEARTCPFLTREGCSVYKNRPDACRTFPVELGMSLDGKNRKQLTCFFRPPDFCLGQHEDQLLTPKEWAIDQEAVEYNRMTAAWSEVKVLFQTDPWGKEGPNGKRAKMAFMSTYNIDAFRNFIFHSSFLQRYKVKSALLKQLQADDVRLMKFGFAWVKHYLFNIRSRQIRNR